MLKTNSSSNESPFDFSAHATIGCGGFAALAIYPETMDELTALITVLRADKNEFCVLGKMSNVLPPDGFTETTVIRTTRLTQIDKKSRFFEAGVTPTSLFRYCKENGYGGVEFLYGIPCTLGGALYMNAGVAGKYISDLVERVLVFRDRELVWLPNSACGYGYKTSVFMQNSDVILGAVLRLPKSTETEFDEKLEYYKQRRKHLPKGKSMGCVFKNPNGAVAGKLVEGAGLKGLRNGGAVISEEHANFIVNTGGATSMQVRELIGIMKRAVFAQYKIRLEEEIRYIR